MKNFSLKVCQGVMLLSLGLVPLVQAQTLDELLQQARSVREQETQVFAQRESEYNAAAPADQERMLTEAQAKIAEIDVLVKQKTDVYSQNELAINDLNVQLRQKERDLGLGEVFGLARQIAGDSSSVLQQSLTSAQFAETDAVNRVDFLRTLSASEGIVSPADLERVWFELQREIVASGQVASYDGKVVAPNGDMLSTKITRIGTFTAMADGRYLAYLPSLSRLNILPRQLPEDFLQEARNLQSATSGYLWSAVDPTRGVLTALYVERPSWVQRIENGEDINYVILVVGFAGVIAFIFQLLYLIFVRISVNSQLRHLDKPTKNNPLGRVLLAFKGDAKNIEADSDIAELRVSEAVIKEIPSLERFQAFLRLAVAAGPLLGLVGTVVGMIMTFQSITESGSSDPKLMAGGIGAAMIATVLGLGIAVPLLFANALLTSLSRSIVQTLDEQSTGILAENLEKQRRHA
jgi:biopolymer transport protein ExbB